MISKENIDWAIQQTTHDFSKVELAQLSKLFEKLDKSLYKSWAKGLSLTQLIEIIQKAELTPREIKKKHLGQLPILKLGYGQMPKEDFLYESMNDDITETIEAYIKKTGELPKENQILISDSWGQFNIDFIEYDEEKNVATIAVGNKVDQ